MKATDLSKTQIQKAWEWACRDGGYSTESSTIKDFLGAQIDRAQYDQDDIQGWCVEYVIAPSMLNDLVGHTVDPFVHANVRIINTKNYLANFHHRPGEYNAYIIGEQGYNTRKFLYQSTRISTDGVIALKEAYALSDDFLRQYFNL